MPLTTIGAQFEAIRMSQGEAAALAFIRTPTAEPVKLLGLPAFSPLGGVGPGGEILGGTRAPSLSTFGPTGTLQQVFNFANRINRDRLIAQQRIEASLAETRMATLAGFRAVAARLDRM